MKLRRTVLLALAVLIPVGAVWFWQWHDYRRNAETHRLAHESLAASILAAAGGSCYRHCRGRGLDPVAVAETFEEVRQEVGSTWLALVNTQGEVVAQAGTPQVGGSGATQVTRLERPFQWPERGGRGRGGHGDGGALVAVQPLTLVLEHPTTNLDGALADALQRFVITALALSLAALLLVLVFALRLRSLGLRASLEASRERVRGLEFLRRLAAGLVHETKNPLGVVRGFAERLTRDRLDEPAVQSSAAAILAETDRTVARLDEFLLLSRPSEIKRERFALAPFLEELAQLVGPDLEARDAAIEIDAPELEIEADREQARRLFLNLLLNASQALESGGRITLRARQEDQVLRIAVEDDGRGVPPEIRDTLFEPYVSSRMQGTGLGLSIAQRIALDHGWQLRYAPRDGGGSRFVVEIPG